MAFMMPVMKNDWDIYNSRRSSESTEKAAAGGGRVRKVSESRSEGPSFSRNSGTHTLSPHRSAPAMRSLSYCRVPPSRASLRSTDLGKGSASASTTASKPREDKFHSRFVEKLKRALGRADSRSEERAS